MSERDSTTENGTQSPGLAVSSETPSLSSMRTTSPLLFGAEELADGQTHTGIAVLAYDSQCFWGQRWEFSRLHHETHRD